MQTEIKPNQSGYLNTGDGHQLFWQQWGPGDGTPLLFLHGGPGCGFDTGYLKLYDLNSIRLITFDQRGCGNSLPSGSKNFNTTGHLIDDTEKLRLELGIPRWFVTGHSWGTALAVLYAARHTQSVEGLILAGLFAAREQDHTWCMDGARQFFPDSYARLEKAIGPFKDGRLDLELEERMHAGTRSERARIARALSNYFREVPYLTALPPKEGEITDKEIALWDIFLHYAKNDFYLDPLQGIYSCAPLLTNVPISLLHGRFDMDCLPAQAFLFKSALPHINLKIVAGCHDLEEEPMASAYRQMVTEAMAASTLSLKGAAPPLTVYRPK